MEHLAPVTENPMQRDLIAACRNGDRDAMRDLYELHQRRVFSVALNYFGGRREVAEDVTQRVFLRLFTRFDFRGDSEFTTWLYRVTINACTDEARKMRRFIDLTAFFDLGASNSDVQQLMAEAHEVSDLVAAEIAKLRPKLRSPIVLKYVEGLSYQEIADVLQCTIGTVASRLNRGHKRLAASLAYLRGQI